jgi:hypothetical protein
MIFVGYFQARVLGRSKSSGGIPVTHLPRIILITLLDKFLYTFPRKQVYPDVGSCSLNVFEYFPFLNFQAYFLVHSAAFSSEYNLHGKSPRRGTKFFTAYNPGP